MTKFPEKNIPYLLVWRFLHLSVHRVGSMPSGQLLVVFTIIILSDLGYYPTVTEIAEITGLPKSSVSRYVSGELYLGFIEEIIDSSDRRRRRLRPTAAAEKEKAYHATQLAEIKGVVEMVIGGDSEITIEQIVEKMTALTKKPADRDDS
jgi:DNA-binding MarR family transcriptional regulator